MKLWFYILFISIFASANDFQTELAKYKSTDNLQMYIYTYLDEIAERKTNKDSLFQNCLKSLWREPNLKKEQLSLVYYWANYAYYLKHVNNLQKASTAYENSWKIFSENKLKRFEIYESCLKPLANIYTRLGDYEKAIYTHKHILESAQESDDDMLATGTLINIAVIYRDLGRIQDAIDILMQAKNNTDLSEQHYFLIYSKLAKNYLSLNNTIKAKLFTRQLHINTPYKKATYFKLNASISTKNKHFDRAQYYLREAIKSLKRSAAPKRQIAKTVLDLAKVYEKWNNNIVQSHYFTDKALSILLDKQEIKPNQLKELLYPENTFKEIFDFKAQLYFKENDFQKALNNIDLAFYVDELLSNTYSYQDSKLFLQNEIRKRSEFAIKNSLKLQDTVKAFNYASKSKSLILKDEYHFNQKINTKNNSLYQVAKQLKKQIASLKNKTDLAGESLKQLNDLTNKLKKIRAKIKENSVNQNSALSLRQIQKQLTNSTLVIFFEGKEDTYIFQITKNSIKLKQFKNNDDTLSFTKLFSNYNALETSFDKYKTLAFKLYNKFGFSSVNTKNIILIPDGIYSTFPFDALLTKESHSYSFAKLPYLIHKFKIHYAYSSALYFSEKQPKKGLSTVLGVFPIFEKSDLYLKYSRDELKQLEEKYQGLYLAENKATKSNFINNCNKFDIIHISTHAASNPKPFVQFKDSILSLEEIYGLSLETNMVVLSACKTGTGRIQKGEGALSLARGFKYAGAKSIMQSLWQVNDKATAQLMNNFYTNLNNDGIKPKALHQAKLDYLMDKSIKSLKKSPYYWASFQYYGNADKVNIQTKTKFNYYWLLLIPFLLIFVYYKRKK